MSYSYSIKNWNKIRQRDKKAGVIISLAIHALIFFIGGAVFVKSAQYNIENVTQSTSVELVEATPPPVIVQEMALPKPVVKSMVKAVELKRPEVKKQEILKIQKNAGQVISTKADPSYFQNPAPEYPELAKQMRQEGLVMLGVDVDREGRPVKVEIIKSSGFHLLDQAALKAVNKWKFQPGRLGDIPVESAVTIPIRFRLEK